MVLCIVKLIGILLWYCRTLLNQYGKVLGLDPKRIPQNWAATQFAEALGKAWAEYKNDRSMLFYAAWDVLFRILRKCKCQLTCFVLLFVAQCCCFDGCSTWRKKYVRPILACQSSEGIISSLCLFSFQFHSYSQIFNLWVEKNLLNCICDTVFPCLWFGGSCPQQTNKMLISCLNTTVLFFQHIACLI